MTEEEFKMEVLQRLSRIETQIENMPKCRYSVAIEKIKGNRRLILLAFTFFLPVAYMLIMK